MSKTRVSEKMFIVRKYVMARSVAEAIRKERMIVADDVFVADDWRKSQTDNLAKAIGYRSV